MPIVLPSGPLRFKFWGLLREDHRTRDCATEVLAAIFILGDPFSEQSNWRLAHWGPFMRLRPDLRAALLGAEEKAQKLYQLPSFRLGGAVYA